ncbi:MAG: hypothetical protein ACTSRZ_09215 [Promethearchaeota archaeon]
MNKQLNNKIKNKNKLINPNYIWKNIDKKILIICWIFQILVSLIWFGYIFGVLGHVCPVAFLGMLNSSLIGCAAISSRRPRFLGTFISLIITIGIWALTFFILHPPVENRFINIPPFIALISLPFILLLIQIPLSQGKQLQSKNFEIKIAIIIEYASIFIGIPLIIAFYFIPSIKNGMYSEVTNWFDTQFFGWDIYNLFVVLSIIWIISIICSIIGFYFEKKANNNDENANISFKQKSWILRYLGMTFLGLLLVGTWVSFHFLGQIRKEIK